MTAYRVPANGAVAELREKGSKFVAHVGPANDESEARAFLSRLRSEEPGATHHCWAWRLGASAEERSSDDGEPAGTAGAPMLQVLRGAELSDVVAVVIRWFGGTKLGKGGLARAYSGAVKNALAELPIEDRWPTVELRVVLPYERLGDLKRLIHPPEVRILEEEYGERVGLRLVLREGQKSPLLESLASLAGVELVEDQNR